MKKLISSAALIALKNALPVIYWYKSDLRVFLQNVIRKDLLHGVNWLDYKHKIASDLINIMSTKQDIYLDDLLKLCHEISTINSFTHLEHLDDGKEKIKRAKLAVNHLNTLLIPHRDIMDELEKIEENKKRAAEKLKNNNAFRERLKELNRQFTALFFSEATIKRGFELEKLMYDLFNLFDLDPKASFKNRGEQVDGAFNLINTDFLFEAKWHNEPITINALDAFSSKVMRKLENTLGLFLSMSGYSKDAVLAHSTGRSVIILMDGADLMAVFEGRIDFITLLLRKKTHAAQTGKIYLELHEFFS